MPETDDSDRTEAIRNNLMECLVTGNEVEPEEVREGVLRCPDCGQLLDEETLDPLDSDDGR